MIRQHAANAKQLRPVVVNLRFKRSDIAPFGHGERGLKGGNKLGQNAFLPSSSFVYQAYTERVRYQHFFIGCSGRKHLRRFHAVRLPGRAVHLIVISLVTCHTQDIMKVALDTDVIIAARRSRSGAFHAPLRALRDGQIEAVASVPMRHEYEAILMRPEQRQAIGMSMQEVNAFLDSLAVLLTPVLSYFLWPPRLRHPDDERVLEAAVNSGAEAIVTFNKRLF